MNVNFKSSNDILRALNNEYWVCKRGKLIESENTNVYDIYTQPENSGTEYFFSVTAKPTMKKSVTFSGKNYNDVATLIGDVKVYNETLTFPSRCYDPMCLPWANEEMKIHWYLTKVLNMEMDYKGLTTIGTYCLKNALGGEIFHVTFEMDYPKSSKDKYSTAGSFFRNLGHERWVRINFDDADDAVAKINSLISVQLIADINSNFEVLSNMTGKLSSLKDVDVESIDSILKGQKEKYRDKVLPVLKDLVKAFENED